MKRSLIRAALATLCLLSVSACTATDPATTPQPMTIVVIGKSVDPYWSGAEAGVIAAGKDFGVKTVFFVPTKEDAAAQIETIETYIKRLEQLENIADAFPGVDKSYALQAGREIRVAVHPDKIDDAQAAQLARDVARKVEDEMVYPGQIKVTVIRETRAVDYAK